MMPAHLKPAGQRIRRNLTPGATKLPAEGYTGPIPAWPLGDGVMTEPEADIWLDLWRKPQAAAWAPMGIERTVARYVRDILLLELGGNVSVAMAHLHSEVRQLEDRLGLSPLALLRLSWTISDDEVADQREQGPSSRRRLRAVDPGAVAGG